MPSSTTTQSTALTAKVPQITLSFWILKLLTTGMGEAASDFVLGALHSVGLVIGLVGFALALWVQFRTPVYRPFVYWSAVMMVAVFGTMAADVVHKDLGVSYAVSTGIGVVAVALTFGAWQRVEGTLSIHSITSQRREMFYWMAVSFTFALGTAAGDLTANALHFGFAGSIVFFAIVFAVPALAHWRFRLNGVVAFWWAYITTRPLGASVADWLSKPHRAGALGYGDGPVAAAVLAITLVILTYVAMRQGAPTNSAVGVTNGQQYHETDRHEPEPA